MAQNRTNFEWGARSAIQKAIRRNDVNVLEKAIDVLWRIEPSWLYWRIPVLAVEGVPQLTGEAWKAAKKSQELRKTKKYDEAKRVVSEALYKLCTYKKDFTICGIASFLFGIDKKELVEPEIPDSNQKKRWEACKVIFKLFKENKYDKIWASIEKRARDIGDENIDTIVRATKERSLAGGMEGDKLLLMLNSVVALGDYAGHDFLEDMKTEPEKVVRKDLLDWPFWCYDMHNVCGKRALEYIVKKYKIRNKDLFFSYVFNFESMRSYVGGLTVGFWYPEYFKQYCSVHKKSQDWWDKSQIRKDLSSTIERFAEEARR